MTQLVAGDSHCNAGGAAITDASGNTAYVCNGTDGQPFSGNFTSPNGQFSIAVTDSGVKLTSPIASVDLTATNVNLSGVTVGISGLSAVDVSAPTIALAGSAGVEVSAPSIGLNPSGCQPAIRATDLLTAIAPPFGDADCRLRAGLDVGLRRPLTARAGRAPPSNLGAHASISPLSRSSPIPIGRDLHRHEAAAKRRC